MTPLFMALVVVCGTHTGVDTCLTQADVTNFYRERSACIARGQEMVKDATTAFAYGSVVGPYRVKIHCVTKKQSLEPAVKGKPASQGVVNAPSRVYPKAAPAPKPAPQPEAHWWWPFPTLSWWPF